MGVPALHARALTGGSAMNIIRRIAKIRPSLGSSHPKGGQCKVRCQKTCCQAAPFMKTVKIALVTSPTFRSTRLAFPIARNRPLPGDAAAPGRPRCFRRSEHHLRRLNPSCNHGRLLAVLGRISTCRKGLCTRIGDKNLSKSNCWVNRQLLNQLRSEKVRNG